MTRSPPVVFASIALLLCLVFFLGSNWSKDASLTRLSSTHLASSQHFHRDSLSDIQNATLGFQKIFVIGFPSRTDKRDAIALAAHLTGMDVEFVDAVDGNAVPEKAIPDGWPKDQNKNTVGCWRAHLNVMHKILKENIQSALIMEDDADWDVMLKSQLTQIAQGARYVQEASSDSASPYGDKWDAMFLGHCGIQNRLDPVGDYDARYYVINDDPTVVPPPHITDCRRPNLSPLRLEGNNSRIVFSPHKVTCLAAYAISLSGARRILYNQSLRSNPNAIDRAMSLMCKYRTLRIPIAVYPPIIGQHRQAGDDSKNSDRISFGGPGRKVASTENVNYPMLLNLESYLYGEQPVKYQWPSGSMYKEIDPSSLQLPEGKPVFITKEQFVFS